VLISLETSVSFQSPSGLTTGYCLSSSLQREQHASDVQSILEAIMNTLTLCADHKEHVKRRLGETLARLQVYIIFIIHTLKCGLRV
jgi:hypothetical protein